MNAQSFGEETHREETQYGLLFDSDGQGPQVLPRFIDNPGFFESFGRSFRGFECINLMQFSFPREMILQRMSENIVYFSSNYIVVIIICHIVLWVLDPKTLLLLLVYLLAYLHFKDPHALKILSVFASLGIVIYLDFQLMTSGAVTRYVSTIFEIFGWMFFFLLLHAFFYTPVVVGVLFQSS